MKILEKLRPWFHFLGFGTIFGAIFLNTLTFIRILLWGSACYREPNLIILWFEAFGLVPLSIVYFLYLLKNFGDKVEHEAKTGKK